MSTSMFVGYVIFHIRYFIIKWYLIYRKDSKLAKKKIRWLLYMMIKFIHKLKAINHLFKANFSSQFNMKYMIIHLKYIKKYINYAVISLLNLKSYLSKIPMTLITIV